MRIIFLASAAFLGASTAAIACPNADSGGAVYDFGAADFPQPRSYAVAAGGAQAVLECGLLPGARGYARPDPEMSLDLTGLAATGLTLTVDSGCDTTLLVRGANGLWQFDDDSNGNLDPRLSLSGASLEGRVDIWVGTFLPETCTATLNLAAGATSGGTAQTGLPSFEPAPAPAPAPAPTPPQQLAGCPDPNMTGQMVNATGDFLYSPQSYASFAAGQTLVNGCNIPGAFGYVNAAPSYSFFLSGMDQYRLEVDVVSGCDTTLLVRGANGQWLFDDDSNGNFDPALDIRGAPLLNGRVDIWIGSFTQTGCQATLNMETWLN